MVRLAMTTRSARYTSPSHDEVELTQPFTGLEGNAENGKPSRVYYSVEHYRARMAEHGEEIYPQPT